MGPLKNADIREAALKCLLFPAFESIMNKMMDSYDEKFGEGIPEFDAKCKKLQKIVDACADSEKGDSEKGVDK